MTDQVECNCAWNPDSHAETCPVYMQQRIESLRDEIEELDALRNRQSDLLSQTAIALRGPESALTRYSHADIPSRVKTVVADLEAARGLLSGLISAVRSINCTPRHAIMIKGDDEPCFWQRREWVEYVLGLCTEAEAAFTATTAPKVRPDLIRFDFINADGQSDSKMITHDDMRERYAALAGQGERQKPVGYVAAQDLIRLITPGCTGFSAMLWPSGSERTIPFYTDPQPAQVNRIPAGLYAELEALRTLRDATGVYLQGYMRDEIEDEESCSADQHDSACTVKLALDKARALEWKGGDK